MCTPTSPHGVRKKLLSALIVIFLVLSCLFARVTRGWPQDTVAAEVIEEVQQLKKNKDPDARAAAARRLGEIGRGSKEAIRALISALKEDGAEEVKCNAADALERIGPGEPEVRAALVAGLHDPDAWVKGYVLDALGRMGQGSPEVISAVISVLHDPDAVVRGYAADALGSLGGGSQEATLALIAALDDKKADVRAHVVDALGFLRPDSEDAIGALSRALKDGDPWVRFRAAGALGKYGPGAQGAVPALIEALKDADSKVQARTAGTLGMLGPGGQEAVPALIAALKDPKNADPEVRGNCAFALGAIGPGAKQAVPTLIAALRDQDHTVRRYATLSLGQIAPAAPEVLPTVIGALHDKNSSEVRGAAAATLGVIGSNAKGAVPELSAALKDSDPDVVAKAAYALGQIGPSAKPAVATLIPLLLDPSNPQAQGLAAGSLVLIEPGGKEAIPALMAALKARDPWVRQSVVSALLRIASSALDSRRKEMIEPLGRIANALKEAKFGFEAEQIRKDADLLRAIRPPLYQQLLTQSGRHPVFTGAVAVYGGLLLVSVALLYLYPLALLRLSQAASVLSAAPTLNKVIGVGEAVFVFGLFRYHPRVLDAWVAKHIGAARKQFNRMTTVKDREVHVAEVPVELDRRVIPGLRPQELEQVFGRNRSCLLVCGEGGSGKTSLACEIARWVMSDDRAMRPCLQHMLPILIEQDLNLDVGKDKEVLTEVIRGRLKELTGEVDAPPSDLVRSLLKRKRILLIVDGLSELNEATRNMIRAINPDFDANALVVTSRLEEDLDGVAKTVLHPHRIRGNRLASFMEAYLSRSGKRGLFDDAEFFEGCKRLSSLVGERDTTVLLAKLYAEQMIALKENQSGGNLPENIPELMLEYVNQINRQGSGMDDRAVHTAAKIIAWECLRRTLRPVPADLGAILTALSADGDAHFRYLEQKLHLVETIGVARDRVRFALDPLAEYLAGLYLVEQYRDNEGSWRDILAKADDALDAPNAIKGFLLALGDCCIVKGPDHHVPAFVAEELTRRASMDRPGDKDRSEPGGIKLISELGPSSPAAQKRVA